MKKSIIFISILIGLLFFLNSSQYLSWFYILSQNKDPLYVDFVGQVLGKFFQALGVVCYMIYVKLTKRNLFSIVGFSTLISANFLLTVLTILPALRGFITITGLLMNILIGILYALYVSFTIAIVPNEVYGLSFGTGIGISCILSYLLYVYDPSYSFTTSSPCLLLYGLIGIISIFYLIANQNLINNEYIKADSTAEAKGFGTSNLLLAGVLLALVSSTYAMGYFVPSQDITDFHISVEMMRLVYFASLVVAGFLNDKSRRLGFLLILIALAFAFSMPLMRANSTGVFITWVISYFTGGFVTICRAIFFLDVANKTGKTYLAPLGLAIGRASEPVGMLLRFRFNDDNTLLLLVISLMFSLTIVLFAITFSRIYSQNHSTADAPTTPEEFHNVFSAKYDLSAREIQILDEILERHSNKEIASILYITEATVKFHVKNLLRKTNCKNRNELIKLYNNSFISQ